MLKFSKAGTSVKYTHSSIREFIAGARNLNFIVQCKIDKRSKCEKRFPTWNIIKQIHKHKWSMNASKLNNLQFKYIIIISNDMSV